MTKPMLTMVRIDIFTDAELIMAPSSQYLSKIVILSRANLPAPLKREIAAGITIIIVLA